MYEILLDLVVFNFLSLEEMEDFVILIKWFYVGDRCIWYDKFDLFFYVVFWFEDVNYVLMNLVCFLSGLG